MNIAAKEDIQTTSLSFHNMHEHGSLLVNLLKARRESFIVRNRWALPEAEGLEYDQYDNPSSRWVAVHQGDRVLAGIRLTPTTARCGMYSYMIRDAQRGLIESIPTNLMYDEAPVADNIWESSRIFVSHDTPQRIRRVVHAHLTMEMMKSARELGATQVLGLIPANWPRWTRRCGVEAEAAGPIMNIDGTDNQVVTIDLSGKLH